MTRNNKSILFKLTSFIGVVTGQVVGLITFKVLGFLILQAILLLIIKNLSEWVAIAYLMQFPFSLYVFLRWTK